MRPGQVAAAIRRRRSCMFASGRARAFRAALIPTLVVLALSACGSNGGGGGGGGTSPIAGTSQLYGSLPPVGKPTHGGTITIGQVTGSTPNYIFPIIPSADSSVYTSQLIYQLYEPLYNNQAYGSAPQIDHALSLAKPPVYTDGNKTVTIQMNSGYKWSNGQPVDANDMIFDIDLIQAAVKASASNWGAYTPGYFPDSLASISATGPYTLVMHLKRAFNPGWFTNDQLAANLFPLPSRAWNVASANGPHLDYTNPANAKKIYDYLSKAGGAVGTFGTNPLWKTVDGPFTLTSFSSVNSSFTLTANPSFGGTPKPYIHTLDTVTYTGITPQLNALLAGSVDIANIDISQLGSAPTLRAQGASVFGYPDFGWVAALYNFKDKTGHFDKIIAQLYVRQALAELENQPAILRGIFKNAAGLAYGPVPAVPVTPYTPDNSIHTPYPFNASGAVALLKAHGWHVVPNGTTTCANAGTGPNQCGAGIPAGTPLSFNLYHLPASSVAQNPLQCEAFASEAKQAAGINIALFQKTFNYLVANFNDADPSVAKYTNDWAVVDFGGFTNAFYPTQNSVFDTGGTYNTGAYNDATANQLIHNSVYGSNPSAVKDEASYLTKSQPALFFPNPDLVWVVSKRVGGTPQSFLSLTQYGEWPQFWYLKK